MEEGPAVRKLKVNFFSLIGEFPLPAGRKVRELDRVWLSKEWGRITIKTRCGVQGG